MLLPDPPLFIGWNTLSILPIYIHQPAMHTLLAMLMDELS